MKPYVFEAADGAVSRFNPAHVAAVQYKPSPKGKGEYKVVILLAGHPAEHVLTVDGEARARAICELLIPDPPPTAP